MLLMGCVEFNFPSESVANSKSMILELDEMACRLTTCYFHARLTSVPLLSQTCFLPFPNAAVVWFRCHHAFQTAAGARSRPCLRLQRRPCALPRNTDALHVRRPFTCIIQDIVRYSIFNLQYMYMYLGIDKNIPYFE